MPAGTTHEHIQEDIVIKPKTVVTKYLHEEAFCSRCNRTVVQAGEHEIPNAPNGPFAKSTAGYLRYGIGISYRKVQQILSDLFGLACVPASLVRFDRKAAKCGKSIYEDVREKVRAAELVHADETSWRNDGKGHFVWFAGNEDLAFFHRDRHRSAAAAKTIFGEDFDGVLVCDRYAAYNGIGRDFQACLAHIITNAKDIRREHALLPEREQDAAVLLFCEVIFRKVCFGTRSDNGTKTHSIIPTLVQTAKRQGVHPREFLHILHTADTATAQAALYNNSS